LEKGTDIFPGSGSERSPGEREAALRRDRQRIYLLAFEVVIRLQLGSEVLKSCSS